MMQWKEDKMTEKERWEALMDRKPVERVAFSLFALAFSLVNVGFSKVNAYDDAQKSFMGQKWSNEMYGATDYAFYIGGAFPTREFGGEVKMPTSEHSMAVSLVRPAIESEEDIKRLEENPPDVKKAGAMPLFMEFSKQEEKHGYPITFYVGGILTRVGYLLSVERMLRWMIKKPDLVHRACRLVTDFILAVSDYWVDTFDPERILGYNGSATESNQLLSPKIFREFALPYQREVFEKVQAKGVKHFFTHICGEQNLNLPYWAEFSHGDPGIISIGHEIDIEKAAEFFPNDIIYGNIEPAIIQLGKPNEVYEAARTCIEKGKRVAGGFIFAPGCEMPAIAPPYNVWVLRKAVNDFGWYE